METILLFGAGCLALYLVYKFIKGIIRLAGFISIIALGFWVYANFIV